MIKRLHSKTMLLILLVAVLVVASVTATVAYIMTKTPSLDNTFEGVEAATVTFYEVYDAYESESEAVNEQIATTVDVMCSVRANSLVFDILEYIRALFD